MRKKPIKTVDVHRLNPPAEGQPRSTTCVSFHGLDPDQVIQRLVMEFIRWSESFNDADEVSHKLRLSKLRNNTVGTLDAWQDLMKVPRIAREDGALTDWVRVVVRDGETRSDMAENAMFVAHAHIGKKKTDRLIQSAIDRLYAETQGQVAHTFYLNGEPVDSVVEGGFKFQVTYQYRSDTFSYTTHAEMVTGLRTFLRSHTKEGGLRDAIDTALMNVGPLIRREAASEVMSAFRRKGIREILVHADESDFDLWRKLPTYCTRVHPLPAPAVVVPANATVSAESNPNPEPAKEATMEETPAPSPEVAPEPELTPPKRLVQKILGEVNRRYPLQQSFSIGENIIGLRWQKDVGEDANLILLDLAHNHLFIDHEDPTRCFNTGLNVSLLLSQVTAMPEKVTSLGGRPYSQVYVQDAWVFQGSIEALFKSANLAQVRRAVPGLSQVLGVITADAFSTGPGQTSYTKIVSPGLYIQRSPGRLRILEKGKGVIEVQHSNIARPTLTVMGTLPRLPTVGYSLQSWNDVLDPSPVNEAFDRLQLCSSPAFQNAIESHLSRGGGVFPGKKGLLFHGKYHAYKGGDVDLRNPEFSTSLSDLKCLSEDIMDATNAFIHATLQHRDRMLELRASLPRLVTDVPGLAESFLRLYLHKGGGAYKGREDCMVRVGEVYLHQVSRNQERSVLQLKEHDGTGCLTLHLTDGRITQAVGNDLGKLQRALEKSYAEVAKLPTLMSQSGWNGDSSLPAAAMYENLAGVEGGARGSILPVLEAAYRSSPVLNRWRVEGVHLLPFGLFTAGNLTNWMGVTTSFNALPMDTLMALAGCDPAKTLVNPHTHSQNYKHAVDLLAVKPANTLGNLAARMLAVTPDGPGIYTYRASDQQVTLIQTSTHILLSLTGGALHGLTYNKQTRQYRLDIGATPSQALPVLEAIEKEGPALKTQLLEGYLPPDSLRVPLSLLPDPEMRANLNELVERQRDRVGLLWSPGRRITFIMDGHSYSLMNDPGVQPLLTGDAHELRLAAEAFTSVVSPRDLALLRSVRERGVGAYQCALLYVIPALASGRSGFFGRSVSEVVGDLHVTALSELVENGKEKMTLLLQVGNDRILSRFEKNAEGFFFTKVQYNHAARVWEAIRKIDARQLAEKLGGLGSTSSAFTQLARVIDKAEEALKYETLQAFGEAPAAIPPPAPEVPTPALSATPAVPTPAAVETTDPTTAAPTPSPTPRDLLLEKIQNLSSFVVLKETPQWQEAVIVDTKTVYRQGHPALLVTEATTSFLDRGYTENTALAADVRAHKAIHAATADSVRDVLSKVLLAAMGSDRGFVDERFLVEKGGFTILGRYSGTRLALAVASGVSAVTVTASVKGTGEDTVLEDIEVSSCNAVSLRGTLPPVSKLMPDISQGLERRNRALAPTINQMLDNLPRLVMRLKHATPLQVGAEIGLLETLKNGELPARFLPASEASTPPTPEPTPQKEIQVAEAPYSHPIVRKNMMVRTPEGLVIDGDFYGYKSREDVVINPTHSFLDNVLQEYHDGVTLTEDRKLLKKLCEELNLPAQARATILSFLFAVAASLPSLTYRSFRLTDGVSTFLLLTDMGEGSLRLFVGRPEKDAYVSIEVTNDGTIFVSQRNAEILLTPGYDVVMGKVRRLLSQIVSGDAKESDNREAINHLITRAYGAVFSGTAELDIKEVLAEAIPANTPDNPVKEAEEPTPSPKEDTMAKTTDKTDSAEQAPSALTRAKETLKSDAHDAAWRTAGSQMVKLTRDPLVGLLSRHLGPDDESLRKKIADFLATEVGTALVAALLATALGVVPTTSEVPQRLARELRIKAMSDMGDLTADVLMGPLRQVIALYLQGVPEVESGSTPALPPASPSATEVLEADSRTSLNGTPHPVAKA